MSIYPTSLFGNPRESMPVPIEPLTPERRRAQTREHLLAAAAEVFAQRGYHAASLDEVAERAGFSKGAVYSNFDSKEDLFLALMRVRSAELLQLFDLAGREPVAIREVYSDAQDRADAWALWTEFTLYALRDDRRRRELAEVHRAMHAEVVEMVERQCSDAKVTPPVSIDTLARVYTAVFQGLWQQQTIDPAGVDDDVFPEAVLFIRRAVEQLGTPAQGR
jgi:AcrR family transcriptional regulator